MKGGKVMLVESLSTVILLSVIVEIVTNGIKAIFPILKGNSSRIVAAAIGILMCISTKIGILSNLNIGIQYVLIDYVITGIVISRGSNAVHDIISVFEERNSKIA